MKTKPRRMEEKDVQRRSWSMVRHGE